MQSDVALTRVAQLAEVHAAGGARSFAIAIVKGIDWWPSRYILFDQSVLDQSELAIRDRFTLIPVKGLGDSRVDLFDALYGSVMIGA